jgi:hypothetical protein
MSGYRQMMQESRVLLNPQSQLAARNKPEGFLELSEG